MTRHYQLRSCPTTRRNLGTRPLSQPVPQPRGTALTSGNVPSDACPTKNPWDTVTQRSYNPSDLRKHLVPTCPSLREWVCPRDSTHTHPARRSPPDLPSRPTGRTPTMTDDHTETPRCKATAKGSGQQCKRRPIPGGEVCVKHGGGAPQVRAAAERRLETSMRAAALAGGLRAAYGDNVPDIDPGEAMLRAVSWKFAEVVGLRAKVSELEDSALSWGRTRSKTGGDDAGDTEEAKPNLWWEMLHRAEDQLVKFAAAARSAGVDERRVKLAEDMGAQLAAVVDQILAGLNLTPEQRALVPVVAPAAFRAIEASQS